MSIRPSFCYRYWSTRDDVVNSCNMGVYKIRIVIPVYLLRKLAAHCRFTSWLQADFRANSFMVLLLQILLLVVAGLCPHGETPLRPKLVLHLKSCAFNFIFLIKAYHCTRTSLLLTKRKSLRKWTIFRSLIICWMLKKNFSHSPVSKRENTYIISIYGVHQSRLIFKEIPNSSLIMVV